MKADAMRHKMNLNQYIERALKEAMESWEKENET